MERQAVESCNLKTVGYDNNLKNLEIEFHSGMVYQYQNVPSHIYANLLSAQSTGTFFTDKIKNRYRSVRLDKVTIR
ncbi:MAG TPA: KTSC domain-containing protein [Methanoregula sp.]|nr:KTSC domain-containing protein [Methanoregula sp.]